jgi:glucosamine--fructose-6-phosphate aminotransferase (isomerizing)
MDNKLWIDIQSQSANLQAVVNHLYTVESSQIKAAAAFLNNDRPVVLMGVASAQYLCMPAVNYLNQRGRFASVACASEGLYAMMQALKQANVIINSRSGETAEIVKLGQALKEQGIPFVVITNEPQSTIARLAQHYVWADTRKDELVSINVVTGMMVATLALAAAMLGELEAMRPQFESLAGEMSRVVENASARALEILGLFEGIRPIYLLYRGASSGSAYCGRLVLEEVARQPAIAMGAAEFRQGPNEVIDERFGAVLFVPTGKLGELNLKLAADIQHSGGNVLLVGQVPGWVTGQPTELVFPIPDVPDFLSPVLEVVPVQILAYELAKAQGYEPGQVRYISKIILSEEGIPNQA